MIKKSSFVKWTMGLSLVSLVTVVNCGASSQQSASHSNKGVFLSITDVHFNPFYDPSLLETLINTDYKEWQKVLESGKQHNVNGYGSDSNYSLLKSAFAHARRTLPNPDFIVYAGDLMAHHFREMFNDYASDKSDAAYQQFVTKTVTFMALVMEFYYPHTPVFIALGNNDSYQGDYLIRPGGEFLKMFAKVWSPLINKGKPSASFAEVFPVGGYYSVPHPIIENHRLIVLNNIFFSSKYSGGKENSHQAPGAAQMKWLDWTLYQSQLRGEKVSLIYHIPVGIDVYDSIAWPKPDKTCQEQVYPFWQPQYTREFLRLMKQYAPIIEWAFVGHTHMDNFRLLIDDKDKPFSYLHTSPGMSPIFSNNPAYQIFSYDKTTGQIDNYVTYYLKNLNSAAAGQQKPQWAFEYNFQTSYQQTGYNATSLDEVFQSILTDDAVRSQYTTFYPVSNPQQSPTIQQNWKAYWCGIGNLTRETFSRCYCGK
jgi:hypothetical protein